MRDEDLYEQVAEERERGTLHKGRVTINAAVEARERCLRAKTSMETFLAVYFLAMGAPLLLVAIIEDAGALLAGLLLAGYGIFFLALSVRNRRQWAELRKTRSRNPGEGPPDGVRERSASS